MTRILAATMAAFAAASTAAAVAGGGLPPEAVDPVSEEARKALAGWDAASEPPLLYCHIDRRGGGSLDGFGNN